MHEAGLKFAIMTDHPVVPCQHLSVMAAIAVREGLDERTALESITINAAQITGISDRVGSLEIGKDADLAVYSGASVGCALPRGDDHYQRTHCV